MIRPATLDDIPALIDMARPEFEPRCRLPGDVGKAILVFGAAVSGGGAFVAEGKGFILGVIGQTPWSHARVAEEVLLYVVPEHRRSGIAQALVEALEAWARAEGATALRMTAQPGHGAAVALYAGLGFEPAEQAFLKVL